MFNHQFFVLNSIPEHLQETGNSLSNFNDSYLTIPYLNTLVQQFFWFSIGSAVFFGFPTNQNTRTASIFPGIDSYLYNVVWRWLNHVDTIAWSKLILNDYPVYGLAVYGLARGGGSFPYRTKNRQPQTKGAEEGSAKSKAHW